MSFLSLYISFFSFSFFFLVLTYSSEKIRISFLRDTLQSGITKAET
nr:MAG TPA: hypothetical protein [Caudoviricetes sp.]